MSDRSETWDSGLLQVRSAITLSQVHLHALAQASFGVGIVSWVILGSVVLNRLMTAQRLPAALQPVTAIELAPPALAGVAWFALAARGTTVIAYAIGGYLALMALVQSIASRYRASAACPLVASARQRASMPSAQSVPLARAASESRPRELAAWSGAPVRVAASISSATAQLLTLCAGESSLACRAAASARSRPRPLHSTAVAHCTKVRPPPSPRRSASSAFASAIAAASASRPRKAASARPA